MNWSNVAEVEELSESESTHHADTADISPAGDWYKKYTEWYKKNQN